MKIITITLNPCIDVNYRLDCPFCAGKLNRVPDAETSYNGKGINVSRALNSLNEESVVMAITSSDSEFEKELGKEGLNVVSVQVDGKLRRNTAILDSNGEETQINEAGMTVSEEKIKEFISLFKSELNFSGEKTVIISGSLPRGLSPDIIRKLCVIAKNSGAYVIADASGENLKAAVSAMPDMIKPNLSEFEELIGKKFTEKGEELRRAVLKQALIFYKTKYTAVLCTLGEDGAVIASADGNCSVEAKKTELKTFKGAGDTFLGAYVYYHLVRENDVESSLLLATHTASEFLCGKKNTNNN